MVTSQSRKALPELAQTVLTPSVKPWPRLQTRSSSPNEVFVVFPLARVKNPDRLLARLKQILLQECESV